MASSKTACKEDKGFLFIGSTFGLTVFRTRITFVNVVIVTGIETVVTLAVIPSVILIFVHIVIVSVVPILFESESLARGS